MHQVLSYETSVRANNVGEFREHITKRTCVSLILSIAFFTLISGYLLGTFVSDRKHHIRQIVNKKPLKNDGESNELTSSNYAELDELHAYKRTKDKLIATSQTVDHLLHRDANYLATSLNTDIYNKYISCTQDVPPNTTQETAKFVQELVDNTAARQRACNSIIQVILDNKLANG